MTTKKTVSNKEEAVKRPVRVPIGQPRDILSANIPEGFVGRWVVDTNSSGVRLQQFSDAGYEFVTDENTVVGETRVDPTKKTGNVVTKLANADGTLQYLMAIEEKYHAEDVAARDRKTDLTEGAIEGEAEQEGHYGEQSLRVSH
jgi:hypothetical protein